MRPANWRGGAFILGWVFAAIAARAASPDTPLTLIRIASGLDRPVCITAPPDDVQRVLIAEQGGRIRVWTAGNLLPDPFLDIASLVRTDGERGLLGLAFDPDYAGNGWFYVFYINASADIQVSRFQVSSDPNRADELSEHKILRIIHRSRIHSAGWIGFGKDGYLYIAVGDGNNGDNAQDLSRLLGKILRIDVHSDDFPEIVNTNYAIPPTNPFVGTEWAPEIWAYGLRNPWRCGFDRLTGDLYVADVGFRDWEEIDCQRSTDAGGRNFGWPCVEALQCNQPETCNCSDLAFVPPLYRYENDGNHCAVIGGTVYRGCALPDLQGTYFFADYCSADVWSFRPGTGRVGDLRLRSEELTAAEGALGMVTSFGEDARGELYLCDHTGGELFQIVPRSECGDCNGNRLSDACELSAEPGADLDGNGILDACQTGHVLTAAQPPTGAIDAGQWSAPDGSNPAGWRELILSMGGAPSVFSPADFCVRQEGGTRPIPRVVSVEALNDGRVKLTLDNAIAACAWTTVTHVGSGQSVRLAFLPGDVDGDGFFGIQDAGALGEALNKKISLPIWSLDVDRSGVLGPSDLLRWIDLFNRAGAYRVQPSPCDLPR